MAVGDIITAARYNNLQSRVATILGTGSGDDGWGQSLNSSQVAAAEIVTATHMGLLYNDISAGRKHQTNVTPTEIALIATADTILDSNSVNKKGVVQFENLTTTLENSKFLCNVNQGSAEAGVQGQYSTAWSGQLDHIVNVTFATADAARHFFNAGGEIRFTANIAYVGAESKTIDWMNILANMQVVSFNYTATSATGTGTGSAIGYYNLTTSYQAVFDKQGSGQYTENHYILEAKGNNAVNPNVITFKMNFNDDDPTDPGTPTDETVKGTLTSIVNQFRPTGVNVEVTTPTYANDGSSNLT
jgi:hypothetical protein|tara:strand:- start:44378 stop:45283 length:906 start_codon:yes stop_codon:yes gene_type:complete